MMIKNVISNPTARLPNSNKLQENSIRNASRRFGFNTSDKIEISKEARTASKTPLATDEIQDDSFEEILAEYKNTYSSTRTEEVDDAAALERKSKLAAMKIAKRIANGDNVPMQDHRWLAEYDSKLYMAALKASLVAENDDPKDYDSLIEEMFGEQNPVASPESEDSELDAVEVAEELADVPAESVDAYY